MLNFNFHVLFYLQVQRAAELVGYFVSLEVWCKMILANVKSMQSFSPVMILASVITGTERTALRPYLPQIVSTLNDSDICFTTQVKKNYLSKKWINFH